ncbi:hypothetical protein HMSSN139_13600 [Paenibacillus sp. HMSSN-139]|nr:hypothetical protein HMSSN139_13600 [Paenibacillus sp. HMSSN-139]
MDIPKGTYGFRFAEDQELQLCVLFAAGFDAITDPAYRWDGLERTDGPLLLFQYTFSGEGVFELEDRSYRVTAGQAFLAEIPGPHRYYFPRSPQRRGSSSSCCFGRILFFPFGANSFAKPE